jgi:hydrogenase maturation protease
VTNPAPPDARGPVAALLVFGYGNPSRGDDALGPVFVARAAGLLSRRVAAGELELLTDFQLQVEHALDLVGRREVLFVDASVSCDAPFRYRRLARAADRSLTSHAVSPSALLEAYHAVTGTEPPAAGLLSIRAERFELGESLSPAAEANLDQALAFFRARFDRPA